MKRALFTLFRHFCFMLWVKQVNTETVTFNLIWLFKTHQHRLCHFCLLYHRLFEVVRLCAPGRFPPRRRSGKCQRSTSQGAQAQQTVSLIWRDLYPALTRHLTSLDALQLLGWRKKVGWRSAKRRSLEERLRALSHQSGRFHLKLLQSLSLKLARFIDANISGCVQLLLSSYKVSNRFYR